MMAVCRVCHALVGCNPAPPDASLTEGERIAAEYMRLCNELVLHLLNAHRERCDLLNEQMVRAGWIEAARYFTGCNGDEFERLRLAITSQFADLLLSSPASAVELIETPSPASAAIS